MTLSSLQSNPYFQDLVEQPSALERTLKALSHTDRPSITNLASRVQAGDFKSIILTGMGSSFEALYPLYINLIACGFTVHRIETSELIHYTSSLLTPATLVIVVSQSGRSAEVIRLLEQYPGRLIAVTNSPESPLAQKADAVLLTEAGVEHSVSCKTYTTALCALSILDAFLCGRDVNSVLSLLYSLPEAVSHYLSQWEKHVSAMLDTIKGVQLVFLAGRGASLAAARTGGLIIKEAARFPAEGLSCAALRHGPMEMISEQVLTVIYEGDTRTRHLNLALAEDLYQAGGRVALVGALQTKGAFTLPPVPTEANPVVEILPAQMLSLALAICQGYSPGQFAHATKITDKE